jgi:hypothetical protein
MEGVELLAIAYDDLEGLFAAIDEERSWSPTGCLGWSVRDLAFHCLADARRGLVALHTPTARAAGTDAVGYWRSWGAPEDGDTDRRMGRIQSGVFETWDQLRGFHAETASAVIHAAHRTDPAAVVATQGHAITVDDVLRTLTVEAAIHHLDVVAHLGLRGPSRETLHEARTVLDALGPAAFPAEWDDRDVVLVGTGRVRPRSELQTALGDLADALPLFA